MKTTRQRLTYGQKRDIFNIAKKNNFPTLSKLNNILSRDLKLTIQRTLYFNIKNNKNSFNEKTPSQLRRKADSKFSDLDKEVDDFLVEAEVKALPLSHNILKTHISHTKNKATISTSYITRLIKRSQFKRTRFHGQAPFIDPDAYSLEIQTIRLQLKKFRLADIFITMRQVYITRTWPLYLTFQIVITLNSPAPLARKELP